MGKKRRGNYVFPTWKGDHAPRHVHVYKNARLIVKWDLENSVVMEGRLNRNIMKYINELIDEGEL